MTFKVIYPEAKYFRSIAEAVSKIVDEVAVRVSEEGISIKALDPAKISLIDIALPASSFVIYEVSGEEVFGVSVANLVKVLKKLKKGDHLEISSVGDYINVAVESQLRRKYSFRNIDVQVPEIPELSLEFDVEAMLLAEAFKTAIRDAEVVGDTVELEASDESALIIRGINAAKVETKIAAGMPSLISLSVSKPSRSAYSLEYLEKVLSLTGVSESVTLKFSSDAPLYIEFRVAGEGVVKYLLAPKSV